VAVFYTTAAVLSWPRPSQATMAPATRLSVRVAASPAGIEQAAAAVERFRAAHGMAEAAAWPLQVALDEILSNIVRHASPGLAAGDIDITVERRGDLVEMTVTDDGPAFDPLQLPEPDVTAPLENRRPGGLGVHLMRKLMDRVDYVRTEERNRLTMIWRPPDAESGGA
jgi:serine/threonine-protein kinase RsbW